MNDYYLLFKWGTLKGWNVPKGKPFDLLKSAMENSPMSAMCDRPDDNRKKIICDLIDEMSQLGATFKDDWSEDEFNAEQAKEYIMDYGK